MTPYSVYFLVIFLVLDCYQYHRRTVTGRNQVRQSAEASESRLRGPKGGRTDRGRELNQPRLHTPETRARGQRACGSATPSATRHTKRTSPAF